MRLTRVLVEDFLGLKRVALTLGPVNVIAGDNWSGKSSLQQALRLAISGQVERVSAKGDYTMLVREGAKQARIEVDDLPPVVLYDTKAKNSSAAAIPVAQDVVLPALLNQHRFSEFMDLKQRRELVFQAGRVLTDRADVERRLLEAGAAQDVVSEVGPLLIQGFDGAADLTAATLKTLRAEWKAITGEAYGIQKAETWAPSAKQGAADIAECEAALRQAQKQQAAQETVVRHLTEAATPQSESCAKCKRTVMVVDDDTADAMADLPRQREHLEALARATAGRQAALDQAAQWRENDKQKAEDAGAIHRKILSWQKLAELIAWDGLPSQLAGEVVRQMNQRLTETAAATTWPPVHLRDDMEITIGGRLWGLCSEAERWTADASLCEAIAWVSGHKLLVLDRMDVLQPYRRGDLFDWLAKLADEGVQSIVFATLKQKPQLDGVTSYWLEAGETRLDPVPA